MNCTYSDSTGHICKFPGVFSHSLHGSNTWRCVWHWRLANDATGPSDARFHGDEIVRQSYEWDGAAESYREMRAKAGSAAKPRVDAHARSSGVSNIPNAFRQVVQDVRIPEECLSELDGLDMR